MTIEEYFELEQTLINLKKEIYSDRFDEYRILEGKIDYYETELENAKFRIQFSTRNNFIENYNLYEAELDGYKFLNVKLNQKFPYNIEQIVFEYVDGYSETQFKRLTLDEFITLYEKGEIKC